MMGLLERRICPGGQTHTVAADGSADFDSIAAAVDAATDGDTILIAPGTYAGSVIIDKDIVILGDADDSSEVIVGIAADSPSVELIEWSTRYGFWVQGGDVEIGNLTITGPGEGVTAFLVTGHLNLHDVVESFDIYTARPYLFIDMREEAGGTFRDNETKAALRISGSAAPLVENNDVFNTIANTEESAARIVGNRIGGLSVSDSATPWIEGNEIDFTNNGSSLRGRHRLRCRDDGPRGRADRGLQRHPQRRARDLSGDDDPCRRGGQPPDRQHHRPEPAAHGR